MRRALHLGIFIGTLIGCSACATAEGGQSGRTGVYGSIDAGRTN